MNVLLCLLVFFLVFAATWIALTLDGGASPTTLAATACRTAARTATRSCCRAAGAWWPASAASNPAAPPVRWSRRPVSTGGRWRGWREKPAADVAAGYAFPPDDGPDSPWPIFERVLTFEELELQAQLVADYEVRFAFVMRMDYSDGGWSRGQKTMLGTACMPRVTGALAGLFDQLLEDTLGYRPDFLITLNAEWWGQATDREREILVAHEVSHCGQALDTYGMPRFNRQTAAPILSMVEHDVEEFNWIVRRYGPWKGDIQAFLDAAAEGLDRSNGGPGDLTGALLDHLGALEVNGLKVRVELASASRERPEPAPLVDAELPPNVANVDELECGEPSHRESVPDVF
jgi:hypothetical protein